MPTMNHFSKTPHEADGPSAFPDVDAPLFASFEALEGRCRIPRWFRLLGLATHLAVSAIYILGDLFQSPTLLGFALQSLHPNRQSLTGFPVRFRSRAFLQNLQALHRRPSDLILSAQPSPPAPRFFTPGRERCSPEPLGLSGFLLRQP